MYIIYLLIILKYAQIDRQNANTKQTISKHKKTSISHNTLKSTNNSQQPPFALLPTNPTSKPLNRFIAPNNNPRPAAALHRRTANEAAA